MRNARLHDARHTAATVCQSWRVPLPAVMEPMGWSNAAVAKRYMHVDTELVTSVAEQVGARTTKTRRTTARKAPSCPPDQGASETETETG
ncbi:hypothetical protein [Amycolatopsis sp. CA-128772]|uniref:hypothetical protein n=1 Tax=Amycolatopsis sp. CA-128772 TaxID=2073159 RepID=UPI001E554FEB|nr:hypothetical protein [Amycolatopsis sp. CA-128772]